MISYARATAICTSNRHMACLSSLTGKQTINDDTLQLETGIATGLSPKQSPVEPRNSGLFALIP